MPTQEERLGKVEHSLNQFQTETLKAYRDMAFEMTMVKGLCEDSVRRMLAMNQRLDGVDLRLDRVDQRFDRVDQRFDRMDQRLDSIDQSVNQRFDTQDKRLEGLDKRLEGLDKKFDQVLHVLSTLVSGTRQDT
jgi:archaellum component FlaC